MHACHSREPHTETWMACECGPWDHSASPCVAAGVFSQLSGVQHLISREGTLIVLGDGTNDAEVEAQDTSALLPQELEAQRATAVDRRILAVNPNYVLE